VSDLVLLVTSRTVLRLRGVHELRVLPLPIPPAGGGRDAAELRAYASVNLFVERAHAAAPSFEPADDNAEAVAEICRRLDGLALATPLAAARGRLLPPQELLLSRLGRRFSVLTGGERDLLERQRPLPNTLNRSFGLPSADAHALFARLGVFPGSFTLSTVEAVAGDAGPASWEPGAGRASDGHAGVAGPGRSRSARPQVPSLLTEQRQLCSTSICARARFGRGARVAMLRSRAPGGGKP
jgi:predicted ATPase